MDDLELIEYIESPAFAVEIADIISAAVWFFFDIHASSNAYSVFDPIWNLTYISDWYLTALTKAYYIYPPAVLFRKIDYTLRLQSKLKLICKMQVAFELFLLFVKKVFDFEFTL